jgi:GT2 family glycosyltransferase
VGIVVLNYHHPVETLDCVRRLIAQEPSTSRVLWVENDAESTQEQVLELLQNSGLPFQPIIPTSPSLPPAGTLGIIFNPENLGYAGGNNVGLRLLHRLSIPYAWVLNNDTQLLEGNSEALVQAASARPEVGLWGTTILAEHHNPTTRTVAYMGGHLELKDFSISLIDRPEILENDPLAYVSGCSLFAATQLLASLDYIPHDYFLYYEDPALTFEARKRGYKVSGVPAVKVHHLESLSTGRRSPLMEFYNRRNRWFFIQRYFPEHLAGQKRRIWYRIQKWVFRARFDRIRIEILAFLDFRKGRLGRTHRVFSRQLSK